MASKSWEEVKNFLLTHHVNKRRKKNKFHDFKVMSFCDGFVPGARPKIFFDRFFLFLEIASLKSMLSY